jgi:hypothetical protein
MGLGCGVGESGFVPRQFPHRRPCQTRPIRRLRVVRSHFAAGPAEDRIQLSFRGPVLGRARRASLAQAMRRTGHTGDLAGVPEPIPKAFLRERRAMMPGNQRQVSRRARLQDRLQFRQDWNLNLCLRLLCPQENDAISYVLTLEPGRISPPQARIEQDRKSESLARSDRPIL